MDKKLEIRIKEARQAAKFGKVLEMSVCPPGVEHFTPRPITFEIPGHNGKRYVVSMQRNEAAGAIFLSCENGTPCPGNSKHTICYHCFSALIIATNLANKQIFFCETEQDAETLHNLTGRHPLLIVSNQGQGKLFIVIGDRK